MGTTPCRAVTSRHLGLLCLSLALFQASAYAQSDKRRDAVDITIPIGSAPAPELVRTVARIGEPDVVVTASNTSLRQLVFEKCGTADPVYFGLIVTANSNVRDFATVFSGVAIDKLDQPLPEGLRLERPACIPVPLPQVRIVKPGETVWSSLHPSVAPQGLVLAAAARLSFDRNVSAAIAAARINAIVDPKSEIGRSQAATKAVNSLVVASNVERVGDWFKSVEAKTDANWLKEGSTRLLPSSLPTRSTVVLKADITAEAAVAAIVEAARRNAVNVTTERTLELQPILPASADDAKCATAPPGPDLWPFPRAALIAQLKDNASFGSKKPAHIMVVDSGFSNFGSLPGFPGEFFPKINGLNNTLSIMVTQRGVNVQRNTNDAAIQHSPPLISGGVDMRWHGGAVISSALGSRYFDEARPQLLGKIANIVPVSIVDGGVMPALALGKAVAFAKDRGYIINISAIVPKASADGFTDRLKANGPGLLLVAAAGNDAPSDIELHFPASLGGRTKIEGGAVVITVSGHEPGGKHWKKGVWHPDKVDILAPSCEIPVYWGRLDQNQKSILEPDALAGTSFAAPIVSFVAGILQTEDLPMQRIKERINFSAKLEIDAWNRTYSGGILDVVNAITVYDDILEYFDEAGQQARILGRLSNPSDAIALCKDGVSIPLDRLFRFGQILAGTETRTRVWYETDGNVERAPNCDGPTPHFDIAFQPRTGGSAISVPSEKIISYIRRSKENS